MSVLKVPPPVLKTTRYESVSSFMIAMTGILFLIVVILWFSVQSRYEAPPPQTFPVEIVDVPGGGSPQGDVDAPEMDAEVEIPDVPVVGDEVGPAEGLPDQTDVREMLDDVLQTSDAAVGQAEQQVQLELPRAGVVDGGKRTGRLPLGEGPGRGGGVKRELRWYIRYTDNAGLDEYARQLDFFGIELGVVIGDELIYLSKLSAPQPVVRRVKSGDNESRLYFTWRGGQRRTADIQLFAKAGITVGDGILMQFVPPAREQELARLELGTTTRDIKQVRRTYFAVKPRERGGGYEFQITRMVFFDVR